MSIQSTALTFFGKNEGKSAPKSTGVHRREELVGNVGLGAVLSPSSRKPTAKILQNRGRKGKSRISLGKIGASEGIRTLDNHLGKVTLYQAELRSHPSTRVNLGIRRRFASLFFAFYQGLGAKSFVLCLFRVAVLVRRSRCGGSSTVLLMRNTSWRWLRLDLVWFEGLRFPECPWMGEVFEVSWMAVFLYSTRHFQSLAHIHPRPLRTSGQAHVKTWRSVQWGGEKDQRRSPVYEHIRGEQVNSFLSPYGLEIG